MKVYVNRITNAEHILLIHPLADLKQSLTIRIHSSCITGDIFQAKTCDCKEQLEMAMREAQRDRGAIAYLFQEGRGIGLVNKIKTYAFKEIGYDTYEANRALGLPEDCRDYGMVGEMLDDLGVKSIILLTNSPLKIKALEDMGIKVFRRPMETKPNGFNAKYLAAQRKNGHKLGKIKEGEGNVKEHSAS